MLNEQIFETDIMFC